jgi:PAS domain S-box-containing protein
MANKIVPTGREAPFHADELIVSKTDAKGRLTYCNDVFVRVSGFVEKDLIGAPHSIIRHPEMPRCIFKLLWDTIQAGEEIFAYVVNMSKNGDHYWVLAHVTPSFGAGGEIVGFHSNRRKPSDASIAAITTLYRDLKQIEDRPNNRKDGMLEASDTLHGMLKEKEVDYDRFVLAL